MYSHGPQGRGLCSYGIGIGNTVMAYMAIGHELIAYIVVAYEFMAYAFMSYVGAVGIVTT